MLQPPSVSSPRLERKLSSNLIIHMSILHLWTLPNLCLIMRGVRGAKVCIFPARISVYLYVSFVVFCFVLFFLRAHKKKFLWEESQTISMVKRGIMKAKSQSHWPCWQHSTGGSAFNIPHCVCLGYLLIKRKTLESEEAGCWTALSPQKQSC